MAIRTAAEQQAALGLALGTLKDLQTALDAVPYASQSEAMRYERATLANAIDNVRTAMVLAGGPAEAVEQQLAKYRRVSAEGSTAMGQPTNPHVPVWEQVKPHYGFLCEVEGCHDSTGADTFAAWVDQAFCGDSAYEFVCDDHKRAGTFAVAADQYAPGTWAEA